MKIPTKPEEVTQHDNWIIFSEILGGYKNVIKWRGNDKRCIDEWWQLPDGRSFNPKEINFYKNMQDTKMLDGWLVENELEMTIHRNADRVNGDYFWEVLIYSEIIETKVNVQVYSNSEPFARTVAILKANIKLGGKDGG